MKKTEIRIAGFGGQGVVLAGQILGKAAAYTGMNVAQTQSYGAEARGSAAKSEIIISDTKIGYPQVRKCDVLIAMSQEAVDKNLQDLKQEGILLIDSTNVQNQPESKTNMVRIPATETAEKEFGAKIYANMMMLGALNKIKALVDEEKAEKAIQETLTKDARLNILAYRKGRELAKPKPNSP
jgi:2-oxoglutarate ferredoxin oxidoreductase subunit gamma